MHRNTNITDNLNGTFHNAEILNFWRLENVDNQTTHAIQHYRNQVKYGNLMFCETNAYSTQYAFSSDSFKYINNNLCPSPRISEEWVRGVYYPKDGKQVHPYINIK